jgi:hypothetical protein
MQLQICKHCGKQIARYYGVPGEDDQWYHLKEERKELNDGNNKEMSTL